MSALSNATRPDVKADPVDVLRVRAEVRAYLVDEGEMDLHEAVDELHASAIASGVVERIGQDAVQKILAAAFGGGR